MPDELLLDPGLIAHPDRGCEHPAAPGPEEVLQQGLGFVFLREIDDFALCQPDVDRFLDQDALVEVAVREGAAHLLDHFLAARTNLARDRDDCHEQSPLSLQQMGF
ncbi:MAG: hypothetical protein M5R40_09975 [Anaerolineae bacterium]|nr:hypothetical protein [Anaerolineae bacterium]